MNNSPFIILSFPRFAGGKFISNCLSSSKYCCPQDLYTASQLLINPDDYDFRLQRVMTTLPTSKNDMLNWISKFEFGDMQMYGPVVKQWQSGVASTPTKLVGQLIDQKLSLFLTAHGGDQSVRNLLDAWPGSTVIKLINHVAFSEISKNLKSRDNSKNLDDYAGNYCKKKYQALAGVSWPTWENFESVGYNIRRLPEYSDVVDEIEQFYNWDNIDHNSVLINIDQSIFDKTKFLTSMEKLYADVGFDDFNPALIEEFWQAYITLHC
jgi:hypothetical protein